MQPGMWELRVTTAVGKRRCPRQRAGECITQTDIDHATKTLPRPDGDCTLSNIQRGDNRTTYDLACKRDEFANRGRMELVAGAPTTTAWST